MPFISRVNDALLYRGSDGREAFVIVEPGKAFIVTDIHGEGQPNNAVPFSREALRTILEMVENASKRSR